MPPAKFPFLSIAFIAAISLTAKADTVDFVRDVQPILQQHCYRCHGEKKQKSGLRLDIKSEAFKGGESYGPSVVAGDLDGSPLIELVTSDDAESRMPPGGKGLSAEQIDILRQWIKQGAVWPDGVDLSTLKDPREHWSFQPRSHPSPPSFDSDWPRNEVDRFIFARLQAHNLVPSPEADRLTWLRRVYFDLIGLPPTPEQVRSFSQDDSNDPYAKVVEALLGSHHYGERWAQHWLDVVRYADTDGFEVNTPRANAWPYRDYVIDAFNSDLPYDQFIRQQLAGDALHEDAATGFLVTAAALLPGQIGQDDVSKRLARQDALAEILINTGEAFLGLSIGCARCHDHKFDPVTQRDYYSMQAIFSGVQYGERPMRSPETEERQAEIESMKLHAREIDQQLARFEPLANVGLQSSKNLRAVINAKSNLDRFAPVTTRSVRFVVLETNNLEPCIDELEVFDTNGNNVALASAGTTTTTSGSAPASENHKLEHINDGLYGNSRSWMSSEVGGGWVELTFDHPQTIDRVVWGRDRQEKYKDRLSIQYQIEVVESDESRRIVAASSDRAPFAEDQKSELKFSTVGLTDQEAAKAQILFDNKQRIDKQIAAAMESQNVFAGNFISPQPTHLLARGDPEQPLEEVSPNVIAALGTLNLPADPDEQARRSALADWITDPTNPLTARVMVNRIWQWHFGTGLVETSSDFGVSGTQPSHPELLDTLANRFIESGWSVKAMHRLMVLSATYRQSNRVDDLASAVDADSRLLWRFPSRRLESEAIRDSMLAVSGRLNRTTGGPGFDLFKSRGGLNGFPPIESFDTNGLRRMIYAHKIRMEREIVFGAFDCPDAGQSMPRRRQSTTPIQALNLFNSQFTIDQSKALAARIQDEAGDNVNDQVQLTCQLALGREADPDEINELATVASAHGLESVCRAVFNSNEFLFLP